MMAKYGMQVPHGIILAPKSPDLNQISGLTPPLVMKVLSADIVHKSDGGFVALSLHSEADVRVAHERMCESAAALGARVDGYLVEEMAPKGIEVVVGGMINQTFGPMIMFGLGGVYVEVFRDVSFRICPINRADAEDMIDELICKPILEGARGGVAADREGLVDLLLQVGGEKGVLVCEQDSIEELDLNPIIIRGDSQIVVDARIALKGIVSNV